MFTFHCYIFYPAFLCSFWHNFPSAWKLLYHFFYHRSDDEFFSGFIWLEIPSLHSHLNRHFLLVYSFFYPFYYFSDIISLFYVFFPFGYFKIFFVHLVFQLDYDMYLSTLGCIALLELVARYLSYNIASTFFYVTPNTCILCAFSMIHMSLVMFSVFPFIFFFKLQTRYFLLIYLLVCLFLLLCCPSSLAFVSCRIPTLLFFLKNRFLVP